MVVIPPSWIRPIRHRCSSECTSNFSGERVLFNPATLALVAEGGQDLWHPSDPQTTHISVPTVCSGELTLIGFTFYVLCAAKQHESSLLTGKVRGCIQYRPLYRIAIVSLRPNMTISIIFKKRSDKNRNDNSRKLGMNLSSNTLCWTQGIRACLQKGFMSF